MKTDSNTSFYKYENGKMYSTCIECFNKKVRCEFCKRESNKSYLGSHIKRQHLKSYAQGYTQGQSSTHSQSYAQGYGQGSAQSYAQGLHYEQSINIKDSFKSATKDTAEAIAKATAEAIANPNDDDNDVLQHCSTIIVGPSFCGKTHLLLNKLQLIRLCDSEKQIHIITRSPEQNEDVGSKMKLDVGDFGLVVEEDLGDKIFQDFQNCCVVFDDMLDSNQKKIDPFFTRGRHNLCDVYYLSQSYFEVPRRTIRNNSNMIILFQQTLKDIEHIYRDIAGFDISYDDIKELCREAWKEKHNYLLLNRLEDENGSNYQVCNESNPNYKIFNPQTDPF